MAPDSAVLTSSSVQRVREALERARFAARIVALPGAARMTYAELLRITNGTPAELAA